MMDSHDPFRHSLKFSFFVEKEGVINTNRSTDDDDGFLDRVSSLHLKIIEEANRAVANRGGTSMISSNEFDYANEYFAAISADRVSN